MAVGLSTTTANTMLTSPIATAWVKLHTGDPGSAGTANAAVGDATRKQITWAAASGGSRAMSSMSGSWTNGGTSETLTHASVHDASSAGNFLYSFALTASQAWASGNTFSLTSHSVALTPLAA